MQLTQETVFLDNCSLTNAGSFTQNGDGRNFGRGIILVEYGTCNVRLLFGLVVLYQLLR